MHARIDIGGRLVGEQMISKPVLQKPVSDSVAALLAAGSRLVDRHINRLTGKFAELGGLVQGLT
ncbi:hypothetical protein [Microbispora rosea]|uniref:hypothetical protein n=1 Tax=Microbispora rosea TaxID=58117 RepID=UPI0012DE6CEA|nr:hypothetical protein [Microbispora rosea]